MDSAAIIKPKRDVETKKKKKEDEKINPLRNGEKYKMIFNT